MRVENFLTTRLDVLAVFDRRRRLDDEYKKANGVRAPITTLANGQRMVAVGNEMFFRRAEEAQSFGDFLHEYAARSLGVDWLRAEVAKERSEMHQVALWRAKFLELVERQNRETGSLVYVKPNNATLCWMRLAYDLFLVRNNEKLQHRIIERLRQKGDDCQSARFELAVTALMISAGFAIDYEDEEDSSISHGELIATNSSGLILCVEAKSRHRDGVFGHKRTGWKGGRSWKDSLTGNLLHKAAEHRPGMPYIVFVEANVPALDIGDGVAQAHALIQKEVTAFEEQWAVGDLSISAVFYMNDASYHDLDGKCAPNEVSTWCAPVAMSRAMHQLDLAAIGPLIRRGFAHRLKIPMGYPPS